MLINCLLKMMKYKFLLPIIIFILLFSCTKSEGIGGKAVIKGNVVVDNTDALGNIIASYNAQELDVYIIYGDQNNTYDDDIKTSHDGSFEFKYLNKGDYEVFVYSDCATCPKGQDSLVKKSVSISSRKQVIEIDTIHIVNFI